jgi:hypothetical protein
MFRRFTGPCHDARMKNVTLSLLFASLAALGCGSSHKDGAAPEPVASEPAPEAAGDAPRCESDSDCVATCAREGQCCDDLCPPCDNAFHKDALAKHEAWKAQTCTAECPVAKCMAPTEEPVAKCKEGACVVELVPVTQQP